MLMDTEDVGKLLQDLAVKHAADKSLQGMQHFSRLAKVAVGSWQADKLRGSDIKSANNPTELRELMEDPDVSVVFLPHAAFVTADIIEKICVQSPLNKMIIWETNG